MEFAIFLLTCLASYDHLARSTQYSLGAYLYDIDKLWYALYMIELKYMIL